jgi:hypothetical protein
MLIIKKKKLAGHWWLMPVNLSNSRGRDQEDVNSKPAPENSSGNPISKKPNTKKGW